VARIKLRLDGLAALRYHPGPYPSAVRRAFDPSEINGSPVVHLEWCVLPEPS